MRAGGAGGEPSDDGGGSDSPGRRDSGLPEDMMRNFRNRMNRVNNDDHGDDRTSGRGERRRGHLHLSSNHPHRLELLKRCSKCS
eukprot:4804924-Amphidinium_carterae.3